VCTAGSQDPKHLLPTHVNYGLPPVTQNVLPMYKYKTLLEFNTDIHQSDETAFSRVVELIQNFW
jgi:hypothetical protein